MGAPGFYFAVLTEGEVAAGDSIELLERAEHDIPVVDVVNLYRGDASNQDLLRRVSELPSLPNSWREYFVNGFGTRTKGNNLNRPGLGSPRFREPWQIAEKKLERDRTARSPCFLVMFRFGKGEVEEVGARTISFPDQPIAHAARGLVVVARPTAIKIDPKFSSRFSKNALE